MLVIRAAAFPRPPLLLPGVLFLGWVLLQLVPWPWGGPWTVSPPDTWRGLAFLGSVLVLHASAAAVFERPAARDRFRAAVAGLGFVLAVFALVQASTEADRIYGVFEPEEGGAFFGPFVNRNHFAGYMLLVIPIAASVLARVHRAQARSLTGGRVRGFLTALSRPEGTKLVCAALAVLAATGALIATTSRAGLLAFLASFVLAGLVLWGRERRVPGWALGLALLGIVLFWFGLDRLEVRFARTVQDAPRRTDVWRDAIRRMGSRWLTGTGFNTFGVAVSGVTPWALPVGATPWPAGLEATPYPGVRVLTSVPGFTWYREAHNDYLQVLVETGLPGLLLALWAAAAVLRQARGDPWLFAALAGVLLHVLVEFDLQIPAISVLFAVLAALAREGADAQA